MGWNSAGFEIANTLDRRAFPTARTKRGGPPPSGLPADFDPNAGRGVPIRSRNMVFGLAENTQRALVAFGPFVGPALLKRIDIVHSNLPLGAAAAHFNIFVNTSAYVTATNLALTPAPAGSPIFRLVQAMDPAAPAGAEGGLLTFGQVVNGYPVLLDYYVPDTQFFLGLTLRNPIVAASGFTGNLLVYEGVLPSDFPAILG